MSNGQRMLEFMVENTLFKTHCAHDLGCATLVIWSSGAAEQLDALIETMISERLAQLSILPPHGP